MGPYEAAVHRIDCYCHINLGYFCYRGTDTCFIIGNNSITSVPLLHIRMRRAKIIVQHNMPDAKAKESIYFFQMDFVLYYLQMSYLRVLICRCEQNARLKFNSQYNLEFQADKFSDSWLQINPLTCSCSSPSLLAETVSGDFFSPIGSFV